MSKAFLAAFAVVSGLAAAGVDFANQARIARQQGVPYGASDYVARISGRSDAAQAEAETATIDPSAPTASVMVKVNSLGGQGCTASGSSKRCSITNN
jgi:hypothetical protein